MQRMMGLIARFGRDESGVFAVVFGLMAIVLIAMGGAVVDYVALEQSRNRAQVALDAAALALQPEILEATYDETAIRNAAQAIVLDRIGSEWGVEANVSGIAVDPAAGSLMLTVQMRMPTIFVRLVGVPQMTAEIRSEARRRQLDLEVAMVLDNSGSMAGSRMSNLISATTCAKNILFYEEVDEDCEPASGAEPKTNVKIGLVPFTLLVNVGTKFANETWLDWTGRSPLSGRNFDNDDDETTPFTGMVNRRELFEQTGSDWLGCVEARQSPYDTNDAVADIPERLFLPMFVPDTFSGVSNSYLSDYGGSCPVKTCRQVLNYSNCSSSSSCGRQDPTTYTRQEGSVVNTSTVSCIPSNAVLISGPTNSYNSSKRTVTVTRTYSLLSRIELQERICKYDLSSGSVANSRTNLACPTAEVLPLTDDPDAVQDSIDEMVAAGNTNIQQGTVWGLHMLTDTAPLVEALPRNPNVAKVLIVMTDGDNYPPFLSDMNGSNYFSWGFRKDNRLDPDPSRTDSHNDMVARMNEKTVAACASAKALGISVFTIGLAVSSTNRTMLQTCSSGDGYAHFPNDPDELNDVFVRIAGQLAQLRLSQ